MDPAALSLETVTTFLTALSLFLSRLDSRRQRAAELPNFRQSLFLLSYALSTWERAAANTNNTVLRWVQGEIDTDQMQQRIGRAFKDQGDSLQDVARALFGKPNGFVVVGDPESWKSVRHLLALYGPELLAALETGMLKRESLIRQLGRDLPDLREATPEVLTETLMNLESTAQKLGLAAVELNEFIRDTFPFGEK